MSVILEAKSIAKSNLANTVEDKNISIHCYYYSILLRLKAYLMKQGIDYNTKGKNTHKVIIDLCENNGIFKLNGNNYRTYIKVLKDARLLADYSENKCYNIDNKEFTDIKKKFNKLDELLKKQLI